MGAEPGKELVGYAHPPLEHRFQKGRSGIFDIINDSLPMRYKAELKDRSYAEGASKEGKALEEFQRDQKTRSGQRLR